MQFPMATNLAQVSMKEILESHPFRWAFSAREKNHLMLKFLIIILLITSEAKAGWFGYDNYEDWMLGRMKGQTQTMYRTADKACKKGI